MFNAPVQGDNKGHLADALFGGGDDTQDASAMRPRPQSDGPSGSPDQKVQRIGAEIAPPHGLPAVQFLPVDAAPGAPSVLSGIAEVDREHTELRNPTGGPPEDARGHAQEEPTMSQILQQLAGIASSLQQQQRMLMQQQAAQSSSSSSHQSDQPMPKLFNDTKSKIDRAITKTKGH